MRLRHVATTLKMTTRENVLITILHVYPSFSSEFVLAKDNDGAPRLISIWDIKPLINEPVDTDGCPIPDLSEKPFHGEPKKYKVIRVHYTKEYRRPKESEILWIERRRGQPTITHLKKRSPGIKFIVESPTGEIRKI